MVKMKFNVETVLASGGRLGKVTTTVTSSSCNNGTAGTLSFDTPMCTLFTKGGSAPYLSQAMLDKIQKVPPVATVALGSLAEHHDSVAAHGKGVGAFTSLKDKLIFLTLHDASKPVPSGKNDKTGIAVWGKGGKVKLDPPLYQRILADFKPDWAVALGDGDTDETSGRKRLMKAVNKTLDFLDDAVDGPNSTSIFQETCLIGSVIGGFNLDERKRSARETAMRPVQGFLIEGFEKGHSGVDLFESKEFTSIVQETLRELPEEGLRVMETVWSPLQVVQAFNLGIDVFSSAYPHTLTEQGRAMTLRLQPQQHGVSTPTDDAVSTPVGGVKTSATINLKEERFRESFSPILEGCDCYSCQNFTCAYIHHLLNTSELLAYVLLTIHNFHQYFEFFHVLREWAGQGKLGELQQWLAGQEEGGGTR